MELRDSFNYHEAITKWMNIMQIFRFFISLPFLIYFGTVNASLIDETLPHLDLPTIEGKHLTNKSFQGHVSLLNIWSSWCGYCRAEHETLLKIKKETGIAIFGLDFKDNPKNAKLWLEEAGNPYKLVALDTEGKTEDDLGIYGTPETFIIDKKGHIRYRFLGPINETEWKNTLLPIMNKLSKNQQ